MGRAPKFTDEQKQTAREAILNKLEGHTHHYLKLGSGSKLPSDEMGAWRGAIRELLKEGKIVKSTKARGKFKLASNEETPEEPVKEPLDDPKIDDDVKALIEDAIALLQSACETVTIPNRDADLLSALMQTREASGLLEKMVREKVEGD